MKLIIENGATGFVVQVVTQKEDKSGYVRDILTPHHVTNMHDLVEWIIRQDVSLMASPDDLQSIEQMVHKLWANA